jgi:hypothetical protein
MVSGGRFCQSNAEAVSEHHGTRTNRVAGVAVTMPFDQQLIRASWDRQSPAARSTSLASIRPDRRLYIRTGRV